MVSNYRWLRTLPNLRCPFIRPYLEICTMGRHTALLDTMMGAPASGMGFFCPITPAAACPYW
jgi:hypothetical protein